VIYVHFVVQHEIKKELQIFQKTAKEQNENELIVHQGIMDPLFHCKV
jgi:hypothetical protein